MRSAAPGHCTNCHAEFEPTVGRELCPPCARAFVMGMNRADGGKAHESFRKGLETGVEMENDRLRRLFLFREELGLNTFAEVVQAVWPEE